MTEGATVYALIPSPVGELLLARREEGVIFVEFHPTRKTPEAGWRQDQVALADVAEQLAAYFAGELREFDLPLAPQGTPFQLKVWTALQTIPYGETISYSDLAKRLGDVKAVRAVGAANGRNPIAIIIPCHRVIGSNGSLVGYGGGLERKEALLSLERYGRVLVSRQLPLF